MKFKRVTWKVLIGHSVAFLKSALEIYNGIKRKDVLSVSMGIANGAKEFIDLLEIDNDSIEVEAKSMGLCPLFTDHLRSLFVLEILNNVGITPYTIEAKSKGNNFQVIDMPNSSIYFLCSGSHVNSVFVTDNNKFLSDFRNLIKNSIGTHTVLIYKFIGRSIFRLSKYEQNTSDYVCNLDIDEFAHSLKKSQEIKSSRSILLYGLPGTGKTTFAKILAERLNCFMIYMNHMDLDKIASTVSLETITYLFKPDIILIDDIDRVNYIQNLLGELEIINKTNDKLIFITTANDINKIDSAVKRPGRFDDIIEFKTPDIKNRTIIFTNYLFCYNISYTQFVFDFVVSITDNFNGAELKEIAIQIYVYGFNQDRLKQKCSNMEKIRGVKVAS